MRGYSEFKGYRSRVIYDVDNKEFVVRGFEHQDFQTKDTTISSETPVKRLIPTRQLAKLVRPLDPTQRSSTCDKYKVSNFKFLLAGTETWGQRGMSLIRRTLADII